MVQGLLEATLGPEEQLALDAATRLQKSCLGSEHKDELNHWAAGRRLSEHLQALTGVRAECLDP